MDLSVQVKGGETGKGYALCGIRVKICLCIGRHKLSRTADLPREGAALMGKKLLESGGGGNNRSGLILSDAYLILIYECQKGAGDKPF